MEDSQDLGEIITKCCVCEKVKMDKDSWTYIPDTYITRQYLYSHSYCPKCYEVELRKMEGENYE